MRKKNSRALWQSMAMNDTEDYDDLQNSIRYEQLPGKIGNGFLL